MNKWLMDKNITSTEFRVLCIIEEKQPVVISELMSCTDLSRNQINLLLKSLVEKELVVINKRPTFGNMNFISINEKP